MFISPMGPPQHGHGTSDRLPHIKLRALIPIDTSPNPKHTIPHLGETPAEVWQPQSHPPHGRRSTFDFTYGPTPARPRHLRLTATHQTTRLNTHALIINTEGLLSRCRATRLGRHRGRRVGDELPCFNDGRRQQYPSYSSSSCYCPVCYDYGDCCCSHSRPYSPYFPYSHCCHCCPCCPCCPCCHCCHCCHSHHPLQNDRCVV